MKEQENQELTLLTQELFGELMCDFYVNKNNDIFMTRDQIAKALEYEKGVIAIQNIHERHKDRLDNFSTLPKLGRVENEREVIREMFLYTERGVYEICRYSRQPKADRFFDWVYTIVEGIRRNEIIMVVNEGALSSKNPESLERLKRYRDVLEKIKALRKEITALKLQNKIILPKSEKYDIFLSSESLFTISSVAVLFGISAMALNSYLRCDGVLVKKMHGPMRYRPVQKYLELEYFKCVVDTTGEYPEEKLFVTPKGLDWLHDKMKILKKGNISIDSND